MDQLRTQVAIIGAGPAGLLLSHLLSRRGIQTIVLERRSQEYVLGRVRAGLLEHTTVELLRESELARGLDRDGLQQDGFELRVNGSRHRVDTRALTGHPTYVYGQQKVVADLLEVRQEAGGEIRFEAENVSLRLHGSRNATVRCRIDGKDTEIACDFIAGCDGFHGVARQSIPAGLLTSYERDYPSSWLGILAAAPPSSTELIYAVHERGFALASMRTPEISRLYLQVDREDSLAEWPDERIWKELRTRLAVTDEAALEEGPVLERSLVELRSYVAEPMQYGALFLAGDAAHIVPPTAAKGLNLAVEDVKVLSQAFDAYYNRGNRAPLESYSEDRLPAIWEAQDFSDWMADLLHRTSNDDYGYRLQRARLNSIVRSPVAARQLAHRYVGMSRQPASDLGPVSAPLE